MSFAQKQYENVAATREDGATWKPLSVERW